jgi:RNA polymerase sigma-70 factor, ECF subfamily
MVPPSDQPVRTRADRRVDWSALMGRAQAGDRDAYRRLLLDLAPYLRSLARKQFREPSEIEDGVQDVLLTLHAIRHTYDPARPFGPWLVAIAQRRFTDRLRKRGRTRARETSLEPHHETYAAPEANFLFDLGEGHALRHAVARLPPGQRDAITMLKLEELSLKEASMRTGMSITSLKVATHRAIKRLRKMLGAGVQEP